MDQNQQNADDVRLRAIIRARQRFTFSLALVVSLSYSALILVMAFLPRWLAVPIWPGSGISSGLLVGFLYAVLSVSVMGIWVRRRVADGDARAKGSVTRGE